METRDLHPDEISNKNLLEHIRGADGGLPPTFVGMTFVRHVKEGRGWDSEFAWAIYISHDPCHDDHRKRSVLGDDRSTVIAFHRNKGIFRIIGRELPKKLALELARGDLPKIGEQPPYTNGRLLYFWFLYDWESRDKQLLLKPPGPDYVYRPNEKLYRCVLGIDPPLDKTIDEILASVEFEEAKTKEPLGSKEFSEYLAHHLFSEVHKFMPPETFGYGLPGIQSRFFRGESAFTLKSKWGNYIVQVTKILDPSS